MARNIEVRYYLAAIALAIELNYTRAAHRVGLTQSAFSCQIVELEEKVGVSLFTHGHKKGNYILEKGNYILATQGDGAEQ